MGRQTDGCLQWPCRFYCTYYTITSSTMPLSNHLHFPAVRATGQGSVCELCPLWRTKKGENQLTEAGSCPVKALREGKGGIRTDLLGIHIITQKYIHDYFCFSHFLPRLPMLLLTRKVFLQCPQMTLTPTGCGSGLRGPGCTGPRLMILLL